MRGRLVRHGFGADRAFRWRGGEISRLEGLSDAVFAFAVCFGILFWVWYDHYRFFRRYGLDDGFTTTLTGVLLFIVLFYVYPMKFLFSTPFDQLFGEAPANAIEPRQVPLLMLVYGAGFIAVQLVFILLYLHAYGRADSLELDTYERLTTRAEIQGFGLNVAVGLASIAIVTVGGPDAAFWSGMAYMLIMPLQTVNGRLMRTRIRQAAATPQDPAALCLPSSSNRSGRPTRPESPANGPLMNSTTDVATLSGRRRRARRAGAAQWTSNGAPPSAVTLDLGQDLLLRQAGGGAGGDLGVGLGNGRHQSGIAQDREGLLERLQVLEVHQDGHAW